MPDDPSPTPAPEPPPAREWVTTEFIRETPRPPAAPTPPRVENK